MRLSLSFLLCCGFLLGSSLSWSACTQADPADEDPESIARRRYVEDIQSVEVSTATQGTFQRELISNGKLRASREATIGFRSTQEIQEVRVHNGQRVQKGDTLAVLDYFREQVAFEQTQQAVEGAELERKDVLMLQGYYIYKDSVEIPEEILRMANNKSGLLQAISERTLAQRKLEDAFVIAPFSGRIADLQAQAHNLASQYEFFCLLLDDRSFEVAFTILEGELARVQVGQDVTIIPMNVPINQTIGKVQSLNPRVDEDGMVQVMASVRNSRSGLLPGMNVRVVLQQSLADQLMVPKSAVVLRQGREVVFTAKHDTAWWHYVTTRHENTNFVTIEEGIQAGDTIIVTGNLNLAHKVPIRSR